MNDSNGKNHDESLSFGRYLKDERLRKGLDLDYISNETKISIRNLICIEAEEHHELPADVFVKSYLRSFAACLGLDGEEIVRSYVNNRTAHEKTEGIERLGNKSRWKIRQRLFIIPAILLGVIIVILVSYLILHRTVRDTPQINREENAATTETEMEKTESSTVSSQVHMSNEKENILSKKLILSIDTIEKTWIKVIIDEQRPKEFSLKPQDHLTLEADNAYNLLIGNGAGVRLSLNGKPVNVSEKSGEVVNIQLP